MCEIEAVEFGRLGYVDFEDWQSSGEGRSVAAEAERLGLEGSSIASWQKGTAKGIHTDIVHGWPARAKAEAAREAARLINEQRREIYLTCGTAAVAEFNATLTPAEPVAD